MLWQNEKCYKYQRGLELKVGFFFYRNQKQKHKFLMNVSINFKTENKAIRIYGNYLHIIPIYLKIHVRDPLTPGQLHGLVFGVFVK